MVASSSFDSPISPILGALQTGATARSGVARADAQRPTERPDAAATTTGQPTGASQDPPIRGDRPVSQSLSTAFVAQFIAQEIDPSPSRPQNAAETSRAFEAFQRALATATPPEDPSA